MRYELRAEGATVTADLPHARHQPTLAPGSRARFVVPPDELLVLSPRPA